MPFHATTTEATATATANTQASGNAFYNVTPDAAATYVDNHSNNINQLAATVRDLARQVALLTVQNTELKSSVKKAKKAKK